MASTKLNYQEQVKNRFEDSASTGDIPGVDTSALVVLPNVKYDFAYDELSLGNPGVDYLIVESDGFIVKHGGAQTYEDIYLDVAIKASGANAPSFDNWFGTAPSGISLYTFADEALSEDEDEIDFSAKLPRGWNYDGVFVKVHWVGDIDESGVDVRWGLESTWADIGVVFPTTTVDYITYQYPADVDLIANKHYVTSFSFGAGPSATEINSIILGRLFRNSSDVGDTYTGNVGLLGVELEYVANTLGSRGEYSKT